MTTWTMHIKHTILFQYETLAHVTVNAPLHLDENDLLFEFFLFLFLFSAFVVVITEYILSNVIKIVLIQIQKKYL